MNWRNHADHKSETKAVKRALEEAQFSTVRVRHGTGTAWAWLEVTVRIPSTPHAQYPDQFQRMVCAGNCEGCEARRQATSRVYAVIREVTGRHGDYNGDTNVSVEELARA